MGKRKDSKGNVLQTGEYQRSNGSYSYSYTDNCRKRRYLYAKTLNELRRKEVEISRDLSDGIDVSGRSVSVCELVNKYYSLKRGLKNNSQKAYTTVINKLNSDKFGQMKIKDVKISDAKGFYLGLHDKGLKRNTIETYHSLLRPAFKMACDDDLIRKNPFDFKLADLISNDAQKRLALTEEQQQMYMQFIKERYSGSYYDEILILLGTGMRVSELYGLTRADIDFDRRRIHVNKQLCRKANEPDYITSPKSQSGIRYIPMTDEVYTAFNRVVENRKRPQIEHVIDGYSGFLFLDKNGKPKVAMHLEGVMRTVKKKIRAFYGDSFPEITPHVLRHTFCTNMQQANLDIKSLQYIMGHSNISETLDTYTHTNYEAVEKSFQRCVS